VVVALAVELADAGQIKPGLEAYEEFDSPTGPASSPVMGVELSLYNPALFYPGQKQFNSDHAVISSFVHNSLKPQIKKDLGVAYVLTDAAERDRFVGFYTIAQHMIDVSLLSAKALGSLRRKIPCSIIGMLGVDKRFKGQKLGSQFDETRADPHTDGGKTDWRFWDVP